MTPSNAHPAPGTAIVSLRDAEAGLAAALGSHAAWVVLVRTAPPEALRAALDRGRDADVITISRRAATARVLPDAVCWRRDTLAAVLAGGSSVPATFRLIRRAVRKGARVLDIVTATVDRRPFGPLWADAIHR